MSKEDLQQALLQIASSPTADFDGPKPEALILKAEEALGVEFPDTYRKFLLELGCGDIGGLEFYGVIRPDFEDSGIPDAIWLTLSERETSSLPDYIVLISSADDGTYFALDLSRGGPENEAPVIVWTPGVPMDRASIRKGTLI